MIFNRLTIKCENPIKLAQIRELLVEEDEYQREIFTMKKLLPLAEKISNYKRPSEYDSTWNRNNHGIVQNVISELIHDKSGEISFYYHSNYWIHFSWITVLGGFLNSIIPPSEEDEKTGFSLELMTYDLNGDHGKHFYWDGMEQDKTSPINYGLLDLAVKHHPGLLNYLKIQDEEYTKEKQDVQTSMEGQKNNCMYNMSNHGNC
jgi:hypothetical protein